MKLLLFFILFATGTSLNAQKEIVDQAMLRKRAMLFKAAGKDTLRQNQSEAVVAPGRQVRTLLQDKMPRIVPDAADIGSIPNAWSGVKEAATRPMTGQIPNAWQFRKKGVVAK